MRFTIIKADNKVYVSGEPLSVDCSSLPDDLHALQWYDTWGEIEHIDPSTGHVISNERITDLAPYQVYVDSWNTQKAVVDAAAAAAAAARAAVTPASVPGVVKVIAS